MLRVLDRSVVDQSGLTDRYDFTVDWRPDEFKFPNTRAAVAAATDALPDLSTAFQEQLGPRLGATSRRVIDVKSVKAIRKALRELEKSEWFSRKGE